MSVADAAAIVADLVRRGRHQTRRLPTQPGSAHATDGWVQVRVYPDAQIAGYWIIDLGRREAGEEGFEPPTS